MTRATAEQIEAIEGWFLPLDRVMFDALLEATAARLGGGDLAEMGSYLGKSAVLLGGHRAPGETLTVADLFGSDPADDANRAENAQFYTTLTKDRFEANFRRVHADLPTIVHGMSETITAYAAHGTHRFVHIDASHLYDHVVVDAEAARTLLRPDGIVAFDDIRLAHAPGVAAAVFGAVERTGLRPFAITPAKLYATWGDPAPWFAVSEAVAAEHAPAHDVETIAGSRVVVMWDLPKARDARWVPFVPPVALPSARRLRAVIAERLGR